MTPHDNAETRPEIEELLGAYALDAVEPVEHGEIERYLAANAGARAEVDDLREAAAMLALTANDRDRAPESLWASIQSEIEAAAPTLSIPGVASISDARSAREARSVGSRQGRWMLVAASFVAAIVIAAGALAFNRDAETMGDKYQSVAKSGRVITLASAETNTTMAQVALRPDGSGYLRNRDLHGLPAGKVYQLWVIPSENAQPVSVGIVRPDDDYTTVALNGSFIAVAISIEDAPGAVAPTAPIASGASVA